MSLATASDAQFWDQTKTVSLTCSEMPGQLNNGLYIARMQRDTELNRLYPNASVMWEPPRVFKEPKVATLQVTRV